MLSRLSVVRRLPRTFAVRHYTDGRTEGSVAQSKGFKYVKQAHSPESSLTNVLFRIIQQKRESSRG